MTKKAFLQKLTEIKRDDLGCKAASITNNP